MTDVPGSALSDATGTGTVTRLLAELERGDREALDAVFPIVYAELRRIAHRQRREWSGDETLGTTALVNEAYLKLVDAEHLGTRTRAHFLRVAAMAMRQIMCNYARDRQVEKRGGNAPVVPLDAVRENAIGPAISPSHADTLADLDDALTRLERTDPRLGQIVECRFFGGLSIEDTAGALGISPATVKRDWALARSWLYREMKPS